MEWNEGDDEAETSYCETTNDGNETIEFEMEPEEIDQSNSTSVAKRGRKCFITTRLVAALDNAKVSDGMAVHILVAAAEALGQRVEELVINRSSIHRLRKENRLRESREIAAGFSDNVIQLEFSLALGFMITFSYS